MKEEEKWMIEKYAIVVVRHTCSDSKADIWWSDMRHGTRTCGGCQAPIPQYILDTHLLIRDRNEEEWPN